MIILSQVLIELITRMYLIQRLSQSKKLENSLLKVFIYENKIIYSPVETFNLNIYTHEKCI